MHTFQVNEIQPSRRVRQWRRPIAIASGLSLLLGVGLSQASGAAAADEPVGALSCSLSSVPTLDVPAAAQLSVTPGLPYVLVCVDATGAEVTNQVVITHAGR